MDKSRIQRRSRFLPLLFAFCTAISAGQEAWAGDTLASASGSRQCLSLRSGTGATLGAIIGTFILPGIGTGLGFLLGGGGTCVYDAVKSA